MREEDGRAGTPPSPLSPWGSSAWGPSQRTFADALRDQPVADAHIEPPILVPGGSTGGAGAQAGDALALPPVEATLAPVATSCDAKPEGTVKAESEEGGPMTFGAAFATGALCGAPAEPAAATIASVGAQRAGAAPAAECSTAPSFTAPQALEACNNSISMRDMTSADAAAAAAAALAAAAPHPQTTAEEERNDLQ